MFFIVKPFWFLNFHYSRVVVGSFRVLGGAAFSSLLVGGAAFPSSSFGVVVLSHPPPLGGGAVSNIVFLKVKLNYRNATKEIQSHQIELGPSAGLVASSSIWRCCRPPPPFGGAVSPPFLRFENAAFSSSSFGRHCCLPPPLDSAAFSPSPWAGAALGLRRLIHHFGSFSCFFHCVVVFVFFFSCYLSFSFSCSVFFFSSSVLSHVFPHLS